MRPSWSFPALAILALLLGGALVLQRQSNEELRALIALLREQNQAMDRVQTERSRLVRAQLSAAELESLRADHAAITRLRAEIQTAEARVIELERAEAAGAPSR